MKKTESAPESSSLAAQEVKPALPALPPPATVDNNQAEKPPAAEPPILEASGPEASALPGETSKPNNTPPGYFWLQPEYWKAFLEKYQLVPSGKPNVSEPAAEDAGKLQEEAAELSEDAGDDDKEAVASRCQQAPKKEFSEVYCEVLYHLGRAYKAMNRSEESNAVWSKLWQNTANPKYRKLLEDEGFQAIPGPDDFQAPADMTADRYVERQPDKDPVLEEAEKKLEKPEAAEAVKPKADINEILSGIVKNLIPPTDFIPTEKAASGEAAGDELKKGIALHALARDGDKQATQEAYEFFKRLNDRYPNDDLVAVYYADCLSMTGRDAADSSRQFANDTEAIRLMDKAVDRRPDDIEIRLVRGYHGFRLSEAFFGRTGTAIEDFEYVIKRYEENQTLLSVETYWQLLYDLGQAYQRLGKEEEARAIWNKLLGKAPAPKYHNLIQAQEFDVEKAVNEFYTVNDSKELLQRGIRLFRLAIDENPKAAQAAQAALEKAHEIDPDNLEILAYYGSSIALVGRYATDADVMFDNVIKGLRLLNKAINRDPKNPHFRWLRANLTFLMPESLFHMTEGAIEDFQFVISAYEQDQSLFPKEQYWKMLYDLGAAYEQIGQKENARKVWSDLSALSSDPRYQNLEIKE